MKPYGTTDRKLRGISGRRKSADTPHRRRCLRADKKAARREANALVKLNSVPEANFSPMLESWLLDCVRMFNTKLYLKCSRCGKVVSSVPFVSESLVRAYVECPECAGKRG